MRASVKANTFKQQRDPIPWADVLATMGKVGKVLAVIGVLAGIGWGALVAYEKLDVPIAVIGIKGEIQRISATEVEHIVAEHLGGGFLSLQLDSICHALESHQWVAQATARRKWPDQVEITIEEEVPIARWGEQEFLNNQGQVLALGEVELPASLPLLVGPEGMSRRVMQQYRNLSQVLQPTGLKIVEFQLRPRGSWQVHFESGLELLVGKEPVVGKLQRFLLVWEKTLHSREADLAQVDIRYGNGIAVRWKETSEKQLVSSNG